jgi:large subunit ribosomal protein L10
MPKPEKVKVVEEIKEKLKENPNFVVTEYRGMTVAEMSEMRNLLREKGIMYQIYKNTLFRIALEDSKIEGVDEYFFGPVGVAFSKDDIVSPCKILKEVSKKAKNLKIKGGYADGTVIKEKEIDEYASMPSIEELYSKLLGTLINPATRLVRVLSNPLQKLAMALNQIAEKK